MFQWNKKNIYWTISEQTKKGKLKDFSVFKDFIMINDSFYDWYNISDNFL